MTTNPQDDTIMGASTLDALLFALSVDVEAIAAEVGFSSRSHFSRVFRDHYGTDPSTFRRRNFIGFNSGPDAPLM